MSDTDNQENLEIKDKHLQWIFYHGARPLWKYLAKVMNIDITDVCPRVSKEDVPLESEGIKLIAKIVELPHSNELVDEKYNNDVCFLINSVNVVFMSLKNAVHKDDDFMLRDLQFKIDLDKNIFLVKTETQEPISEFAIAVSIIE